MEDGRVYFGGVSNVSKIVHEENIPEYTLTLLRNPQQVFVFVGK